MDAPLKIWQYKDLKVYYVENLDGGGSFLAPGFAKFIRTYFSKYIPFRKAFEWCCGPGFIGFALLQEGLCETLCLADINPAAIDCVLKTIAANRLRDKITTYVSDNFFSVPPSEKFDLMVGNPPNYFSINPQHPLAKHFEDDLRPHDVDWLIHKQFYSAAGAYLLPDALVCISEVEPHQSLVHVPPDERIPFDRRPGPALLDFKKMIARGGLTYLDTFHYATLGGVKMWMMVSNNERGGNV